MHNPDPEQYVASLICLFLGWLGWALPYRWNIFRLTHLFSGLFSEAANRRVPKVVGSVFILIGIGIIIGAVLGWDT